MFKFLTAFLKNSLKFSVIVLLSYIMTLVDIRIKMSMKVVTKLSFEMFISLPYLEYIQAHYEILYEKFFYNL